MVKICIWMNIPSHYQSDFFKALAVRGDVDLQVRYLEGISTERTAEGWTQEFECEDYEEFAADSTNPEKLVETVPKWEQRIHIISSYFHSELIDLFCSKNIQWCHWSEMPGIRLAEMVGYRMTLYRVLNPLMLILKRKEGLRIGEHALGAFGQGILARRAFECMGVPSSKISDLYYTPGPLREGQSSERIRRFADERKIFLSVGALCQRKGVGVLLKAFAELKSNKWCLVLCGLDREDGIYEALAKKLRIEDQVLFLGAYPSDKISEVYGSADVFVLPSLFDGWGAVLNEAASLGLPLIGSDLCGGSHHLIQEDKNGYIARAGSSRSLCGSMREYVDHPDKIQEHGIASKLLYFENFSPDSNAERMVSSLAVWVNDR